MYVQIYIHTPCSLYGNNAMLMCILDFVLPQELMGQDAHHVCNLGFELSILVLVDNVKNKNL